jgi:hypothetical protein
MTFPFPQPYHAIAETISRIRCENKKPGLLGVITEHEAAVAPQNLIGADW